MQLTNLPFDQEFEATVWSGLPASARPRILRFAEDLLRFGRSTNLVSRTAPVADITILIEESVRAWLALGPEFEASRWMDLGSGAGIPALVFLGVAPDLEIDLVERRRGRCDFLRRELGVLGARRARVIETDVRSLEGWGLYDIVSAKAVAPPGEVEPLVGPVLRERGSLVLFQPEGWRNVGDASPGGWRVEAAWMGAVARQGRGARWGFRLIR